MKGSIDQQPSHHDTRAERASTKIEVAIKKDNELYREVKLAIRDAKESEHEYEEDINGQNLRIIKTTSKKRLRSLCRLARGARCHQVFSNAIKRSEQSARLRLPQ